MTGALASAVQLQGVRKSRSVRNPRNQRIRNTCAGAIAHSCFANSPGSGRKHWGATGFAHCFLNLKMAMSSIQSEVCKMQKRKHQ